MSSQITGEASISGDVEVLGFDAADLEGHVGLGLNVTVGLDNSDTSKLFSFDDFIDRIRYNITGELNYGLSARHVWGLGKVWKSRSPTDRIPGRQQHHQGNHHQ